MSDFVSSFWNLYVMGIVAVSLLFCAFIVLANKKEKKGGPVEMHGHVWDETLQEWNNPLPRWWVGLFWATLFFSVGYLALYPGFGNFAGSYGWSSTGQYDKEMAAANDKYGPVFAKYQTMDIPAVAADPEAKAMGERMFQSYCAQCHGSDAKGANGKGFGFPNLTDADWLYGGEPAQIKQSIADGRMGVMPPFAQLGGEGVKDVANYVRSLSGLAADSIRVQRGKDLFTQNCVACHGPDAKVNPAIGAPNLTDKTWLYGSKEETIIETVTKGRNNRMPAHKDFLGDAKVHLLTAYVYGLGGTKKPEGVAAASEVVKGADGSPTAKLYFASGKAEVPGDGGAAIQAVVDFIKDNAKAKIAVSGFHDATGDKATNEELAKNRAVAVRDVLKAAGIGEDRIELRKPAETTGSGDNKEARRVEVSVVK